MTPIPLTDAINYFDDFITYKFPYLDVPSVSIAIAHKGTLVYSRALGLAEIETQRPATSDTPYRVASNSKMFTSVAIMQLQEKSKLRLDDYVVMYLPWLAEHKDARWHHVTIRQLLSHSAGVKRDSSRSGYWSLQYPFPEEADLKRVVLSDELVNDPNTHMKYSNYGFGLLGLVIRAASGVNYNEYVKQHIIEPLGLQDTYPDLEEKFDDALAVGYTDKTIDGRRLPIQSLVTNALSSATGFVSTPSDIATFMSDVLSDQSKLVSVESSREMRRIHSKAKYGRGMIQFYGLGFELGEMNRQTIVSHGGGFPGQLTASSCIPEKELSVSVVINGRGCPPKQIVRSILDTIKWFENNHVKQPKHDLTKFTARYTHL